MLRFHSIKFSLREAEFLQNFQNLITNEEIVQLINITETPSAQKGLELLSQDWFKSKVVKQQHLFGINFKIDEKIDDKFNEKPHFYELNYRESFLVAFQSTFGEHESKTYWKVPSRDKFYSIYIDDDEGEDVTTFVHKFLAVEIKNERSGVINKHRHKERIHLQEIGDINGHNLLILATQQIKSNFVKNLLKHDFDADDVINIAWETFIEHDDDTHIKDEVNVIILNLLKANLRFPVDFKYEKASQEVKDFVNMCESLHKDVDDDDFDSLNTKLESNPNLIYFYNRNSESLLAHSLKMKKFQIFECLDKQISIGCHEDLREVYKNMHKTQRRILRGEHKFYAKEFPETHIFMLRAKSKIGNNDNFSHKKWKHIDEAFETLNSNSCRKIMKIAVMFKKLKIYFDFKHDSTYYMDPATSYRSKGIIYESGSIFIGARNLTEAENKSIVFGVLAHELCHLAVYIAFMNRNYDPFPTGESELKTIFIDQVMVQCKERESFEWIIANVFSSYPKNIQDSEMIVTVPQMMMFYIQNDAKLEELEEIFEELFKYSKEIVEPELEKALIALEQLESDNMALKFNNLTDPMKAAILHSKINFYGEETSFLELIGHDHEILQLLTPEDIKKYILESIQFQIGEPFKLNFKYGIIERKFEELTKKNRNQMGNKKKSEKQKLKTFDSITNETEISKVFILADHAGTGKTTTFRDFADKLRKSSNNAFVFFINLRKYGKIFDKYKNNLECLNKEIVCKILLEILNFKSTIEIQIFKKLFLTGRVILFFDGVDEVCPKYTELLLKIFKILTKGETVNQQWISTRLHYAEKLQNLFKTAVHKFVPYTKDEKESFVKNILHVNQIENNQNETATKIVEYVKKLEGYYYESKEIDNPLMIQIITELYIHNQVEPDMTNRIEIYEAMIEKQKEEEGDKVPISERDKDFKFSVWDAHRVLAFKLIFGNDYEKELKFKLNQLPIIQKWQKEKTNFTSDMIQRYGFVIIDLDDPRDERSSIDFMHRTYAEYFVAKYLIDFMFDENGRSNDEKDKLKFKLLAVVIERPKKFKIVRNFFISYINCQRSQKAAGSTFKTLILEHVKKTLNLKRPRFYERFKATIENYVEISVLEPEILNKLWKVDEHENILKFIVFDKYTDHSDIIKLAYLSFGPNWHEKFNKSAENLIKDEKIEELREPNVEDSQWIEDKNFLKFYDFVDKNFNIDEKKKLYGRCQTSNFGYSSNIQIQIITRMRSVLRNQEFIDKFLTNDFYKHRHVSAVPVEFILDCIMEDNNSDRELMRTFLCKRCPGWKSPLVLGFQSENSEILYLFKNLYLKYKISWEDVQNHLMDIKFSYFLYPAESSIYSEYKNVIAEIFGENISKLADKIEKEILSPCAWLSFKYSDKFYANMKDFFLFIFSNHQERGLNLFEKIEFVRHL